MAFKRNIARLPIIPADAKRHNVTCHYCIVGCGYNAYTWPVNKQGGTAPKENALGADLSKQQPAHTRRRFLPVAALKGRSPARSLSVRCRPAS